MSAWKLSVQEWDALDDIRFARHRVEQRLDWRVVIGEKGNVAAPDGRGVEVGGVTSGRDRAAQGSIRKMGCPVLVKLLYRREKGRARRLPEDEFYVLQNL